MQTETTYPTLLSNDDLEQIVQRSEDSLELKLGIGPTVTKVVGYQGRQYKVRHYPSEQLAQHQLDLITIVPNQFVQCYGRIGPSLVFDYLDHEAGQGHGSTEYLNELGVFLAELSAADCDLSGEGDFESWCDVLESRQIFSQATVRRLREYYRGARGQEISWALEYFDSMPRNFMMCGERLVSVDEKHVRVGPRGIGLIKPMWELSEKDLRKVVSGYENLSSLSRFWEPRYHEFLVLYYLVYGLAFVGVNKDRRANTTTREFHQRRRQALTIIGTPLLRRMREQAAWLPQFYLYLFKRHLKRAVRSVKSMTARFFHIRAASAGLVSGARQGINND